MPNYKMPICLFPFFHFFMTTLLQLGVYYNQNRSKDDATIGEGSRKKRDPGNEVTGAGGY